ncbi:MAG: Wzz/FepE/Etk N-terminal domain-containing protein [Bacteroidia bacterium]
MEKSNNAILLTLYKNRKHIFLITFLASLAAIIVTLPFIIKPKYRSQAYLYPANMVPFFMEQNYNNISHAELLIQFFNSYDVRNDVRRNLRLDKHYKLDTLETKFHSYFDYIFEENIKISLTKYESVELTVLDQDPDTAKLIASAMIESVNKLILKQHLSKFNEFIATNKAYLNAKRKTLDSLQQRLTILSKDYGLLDMGSQLKEASRNYYKLMAEGKENTKLNEVFKNMQNYGPELVTISNCINAESGRYAEVENDLEKSIRDFNRKLTYTVVASEPTKPDIKYWPKRGMVTGLTAIASFVLACLYFIYIDKLKEVFKNVKSANVSN